MVFKIGSGSGSGFDYFEPRLARLRLRLEVFEPMLFITQVFVISSNVYLKTESKYTLELRFMIQKMFQI